MTRRYPRTATRALEGLANSKLVALPDVYAYDRRRRSQRSDERERGAA